MIKTFLLKHIKKNTPRWVVLLIDIYIVSNTFILAYLIRFNFDFSFDTEQLMYQLPIIFIISLISFSLVGSYKGIVRHTGFKDSLSVSSAAFVMFCFLSIIVSVNKFFGFVDGFTIPFAILVVHLLLNVISLIASRYFYKEFYKLIVYNLKYDKRVLIYGAGEAGALTHTVLTNDKKNIINIVGFLDDDINKIRKKINGLNVYNPKNIDEEFIELKQIDEIIISIQSIKSSRLLEIVDNLSALSIQIKIVPPVQKWIEGDLNIKQIKQVRIEDLLGREPINIKSLALSKEFFHKTILITGAAGSIGSEITNQLSNYKYKKLILVDQAESDLYNLQQFLINKGLENIFSIVSDVRNKKRMTNIFKEYKPHIVFHAAAYKHVPFMEENPYEAVHVNIIGTKNIVDLSVKFGVEKFVMISTDKAVNPTNVMGATKRIAEMYINCLQKESTTKFVTTRFGNVLGSNGSVIPLFRSQIEKGGPLTVTDKNITRYFMTIPEACNLVLEAGTMGKGGEIFVFDMGDSVKIFDLALNMIHLSGLNYPDDIDIKITGLRPGEKIYEELLADDENTIETYHKKIMIAKTKDLNIFKTKSDIVELCKINELQNSETTVLKIKQIVPEFISNNSKFSNLDDAEKIIMQN